MLTMRYGKIILVTVLALGVSDFFCASAYARRGGGFSSSSSRSSSSSSRSSSSRSSGWGSSSRRSTPSRTSTWGSSNRTSSPLTSSFSTSGSRSQTQTTRRSAADQRLYDKAKASGTAYSSKSAATTAFKSKYGNQYTARYASKPATRPDHIPQSTSVGGRTYPIEYNQRYGGYGYMGPSGSWVMYDAMADAAMLSMLMSRNHYYYDQPGMFYARSGGPGTALLLTGITFAALICASAVYLRIKQ